MRDAESSSALSPALYTHCHEALNASVSRHAPCPLKTLTCAPCPDLSLLLLVPCFSSLLGVSTFGSLTGSLKTLHRPQALPTSAEDGTVRSFAL